MSFDRGNVLKAEANDTQGAAEPSNRSKYRLAISLDSLISDSVHSSP